MKKKIVQITCFILLQMSGMIFAQEAMQTYRSVQNDIDIMETILDKMFDLDESELRFFTGRSKGYYLDEYGMLFRMNHSEAAQSHDIFIKAEKIFEKAIIEIEDVRNYHSEEKNETSKDSEQEIDEIKSTLLRFLGDYASSIRTIKPNQHVTIAVDFGRPQMLFNSAADKHSRLTASVRYADITAHRQGRISKDGFRKAVKYNVTSSETDMDEDIDLFADIMESSLSREEERFRMNLSREITGLYLEGYGALFTFTANLHPYFVKFMTKKSHEDIVIKQFSSSRDSVDIEAGVDRLESRIKDLVSRFGHTLRHLQSDEWLDIVFEVDHLDEFSTVIMKTQKREIDRLNSQKIDSNELMKRIKIIRY